jgi:hypothetical protein
MGVSFLTGFAVLDRITLTAHGKAIVFRHSTICAALGTHELPGTTRNLRQSERSVRTPNCLVYIRTGSSAETHNPTHWNLIR